MKAALYCRISQDQSGEGLGVGRQEQDCRELAQQLGWEVVEVYVDNDISAISGKPRPAYRRMLVDLDAGKVEAIVAWHADRLYRKVADLGDLVDVCKRNNAQIATVKAGTIDLTTPTGRLVAGLLAQVATYEGEAKADRWKRSIRQRREEGRMPGSGPRMYGWTRDGELIPEEAAQVQWMAQQVTQGVSLTALARAARDRGVRSTQGNIMTKQAVRKLLLNPRIAGYSKLNGEIVGTGQWPRILEPDVWENVRALLTSAPKRATPPRVATLAGLIWCGGCRKPMVTGSRTTKRGGLSRTYRCTRSPEGEGCMKVSMAADVVERVVEAAAQERLRDPKVRREIEALRRVPREELAEMTALEQRLVELEAQLEEPGVPVAAIVRAMDRTKQRLEELRQIVAAIPGAPLPDVDAPWPSGVAERRALVRLVIGRVEVAPSSKPGVVDVTRISVDPA